MRPRSAARSVLATAFAGVIALALAVDFTHRDMTGVDFHTYLAAAIVGLQQGWGHIYDPAPVAAMQVQLDPHVWSQPFLSTPPVAAIVAPFAVLPYQVAYWTWGVLTLGVFAAAFAWSTRYRGAARWIAVVAALAPWWVIHAVHVGQVSPLIAAAVVVAWRLLREDRDVAAGLVLSLLILKPNIAVLVPIALLFTGRMRAFGVWFAASTIMALASIALIGPHGVMAYATDLSHLSRTDLRGAAQLTLATAFQLTTIQAVVARIAVAALAVFALYRFRRDVGMALAVAAAASLLVITYLHGSDLCLFGAVGWIAWHERAQPAWRAVLAGMWVIALPFLENSAFSPALDRWVVCELVVFAAFAIDAAAPLVARWAHKALTGWAALGRRATA